MNAALSKKFDEKNPKEFLVVHPLDDVQEKKMDPSGLGPMKMTPAVRFSLITLRTYLILMMLLALYHFMDLANVFGHKP